MTLSNLRLLSETESRPITTIVCQHRVCLYGHVARYPESDLASPVFSEMDNPGWRRPRDRFMLHVHVTWYEKGACMETCTE